MQILLLSDTHGDVFTPEQLLRSLRPDVCIHLGDCAADIRFAVREAGYTGTLVSVPGNCDYSGDTPEQLVELDGLRLFCLHGHTRGVKYGLSSLLDAAKSRCADAALFGHTHSALTERRDGIWLINPGSAKRRSAWDPRPSTYALLTITDGVLRPAVRRLPEL